MAILMTIFTALGWSMDRILLKKHKGVLYRKLEAFFQELNSVNMPDLTRWMASYTSRFIELFLGKRMISARSLSILLLISVCLSFFIFIGIQHIAYTQMVRDGIFPQINTLILHDR